LKNINKYTITIDKLILSLKPLNEEFNSQFINSFYKPSGNTFIVNNQLQLKISSKPELNFHHSYEVWVLGHYIADLATDCKLPGQKQLLKLRFKNYVFYTSPGWHYYLRIIETSLNIIYQSVSSIEIATDCQLKQPLLPRLCKVYRYSSCIAHNTEIKYKPVNKIAVGLLPGGTTYIFGTKDSGKQIAVYDKVEEIKDSKKYYITTYYAANGFDMSKTVERIEVRLQAKWLNKRATSKLQQQTQTELEEYGPLSNPKLEYDRLVITSDYLNSKKGLQQLFLAAVGTAFVFQDLEKTCFDKNRNLKSEQFSLLDFDFSIETLATLPTVEASSEKEMSKRITAKTIIQRYIESGQPADAAYIAHLRTKKPPINTTWDKLFKRYATDVPFYLTKEIEERINEFN
jgi:uncharacterized protein (UPF0297 family)